MTLDPDDPSACIALETLSFLFLMKRLFSGLNITSKGCFIFIHIHLGYVYCFWFIKNQLKNTIQKLNNLVQHGIWGCISAERLRASDFDPYSIRATWRSNRIFSFYSSLIQLDCRSARRTQKIICQRIRRATTLLRPPLESSRQGEFRSAGSIFV